MCVVLMPNKHSKHAIVENIGTPLMVAVKLRWPVATGPARVSTPVIRLIQVWEAVLGWSFFPNTRGNSMKNKNSNVTKVENIGVLELWTREMWSTVRGIYTGSKANNVSPNAIKRKRVYTQNVEVLV